MIHLLEMNDADLAAGLYTATLELSDHAPYRPGVAGLALTPEDDGEDVTILLDEARAQRLVNALVRHFGLEVPTAERLRADDDRDEALAEQTDTRLLGPRATTPDA